MDTPLSVTDRLFHADLAPEDALKRLREGTQGAEDGELFLEYRESEAISLDDGRIRSASYDTTRGFGLRAVHGEAAGYAHSGEISDAALARAATTVQAVRQGRSGTLDVGPRATNARLYEPTNPLTEMDFAAKTALLMEIDAHARALDPRVVQVSASITGEWQAVQILRPDGSRVADIRPLVRFNVSIVVEEKRAARNRLLRHRRALRLCARAGEWRLAVRRGRGAAPGAGEPVRRRRPGRRAGGGARLRLARHPPARGDRPRARGRLQPQEDLRLRRACSARASPPPASP
jgi:TldD protein